MTIKYETWIPISGCLICLQFDDSNPAATTIGIPSITGAQGEVIYTHADQYHKQYTDPNDLYNAFLQEDQVVGSLQRYLVATYPYMVTQTPDGLDDGGTIPTLNTDIAFNYSLDTARVLNVHIPELTTVNLGVVTVSPDKLTIQTWCDTQFGLDKVVIT